MTEQSSIKAGEVAVNSLDLMSKFEQKSVQILRHANYLFEKRESFNVPNTIKDLFSNQCSRFLLSDLISIFAIYNLRPIVRHHPSCLCVGADENVFANILRFSLEDQENEVKILGSLLIKSEKIETLYKKAKLAAFLINEDLKNTSHDHNLDQTFYHKHLN